MHICPRRDDVVINITNARAHMRRTAENRIREEIDRASEYLSTQLPNATASYLHKLDVAVASLIRSGMPWKKAADFVLDSPDGAA